MNKAPVVSALAAIALVSGGVGVYFSRADTEDPPQRAATAATMPKPLSDLQTTTPVAALAAEPWDAVNSNDSDALLPDPEGQDALPEAPVLDDDPRLAVAALAAQLSHERAARQALEKSLTSLQQSVAQLQQELQAAGEPDAGAVAGGAGRGSVDEQTLLAAGFQPELATELTQRWNDRALEQLYLRDQAVREGWVDTDRYRDERRELRRSYSIKDNLEPDDYDRFLYALGEPNRVSVATVIDGSAAQTVGLLPGDQILNYGGSAIYTSSDLRNATSGGEADDTVTMEVDRNGQLVVLTLPRGPIGIQMEPISVQP